MRVIDGMHRLRAAILNGRSSIQVEFFDGSDEEAFVRSVAQNVAHGLPLTLADRKRAAARILGRRPALSNRSVASVTGLSPKTVGAIRARASGEIPQLHERLGRDGRVRPLDGSELRLRAAEAIRGNPGASLREIAASAGISPGTARDVQARLRAGDNPAPGRVQRSRHSVKEPTGGVVGAAGSAATAGTGGPSLKEHQLADEISSILEKLHRDPALRYSEAGRRVLQVIQAKKMDAAAQSSLIQASPPHSRPLLARLASHNASAWKKIADELHRQSPAG